MFSFLSVSLFQCLKFIYIQSKEFEHYSSKYAEGAFCSNAWGTIFVFRFVVNESTSDKSDILPLIMRLDLRKIVPYDDVHIDFIIFEYTRIYFNAYVTSIL